MPGGTLAAPLLLKANENQVDALPPRDADLVKRRQKVGHAILGDE